MTEVRHHKAVLENFGLGNMSSRKKLKVIPVLERTVQEKEENNCSRDIKGDRHDSSYKEVYVVSLRVARPCEAIGSRMQIPQSVTRHALRVTA